MQEALVVPVILGIAYAAAPGVVNTECLRRGFSSGFRSAFGVQLGALLGDGIWAVIAFSGLAALSRASSLLDLIGLAGRVRRDGDGSGAFKFTQGGLFGGGG